MAHGVGIMKLQRMINNKREGGLVMREFIKLEVSGGRQVPVLIDSPSNKPHWTVVLFAGGLGNIKLGPGGPRNLENNFLLRTSDLWLSERIAYAIVDAPSNQPDGMRDTFRLSEEHAQDIRAVVSEVTTRYSDSKIALVGTSRGTVSVGGLLKRDPTLAAAYVLTSPITSPSGDDMPGMVGMEWPPTERPVLVVSNKNDKCCVSLCPGAYQLAKRNGWRFLKKESDRVESKRPCQARTPHGFLGIEQEVIKEIATWLDDPNSIPVAT